MDRLDRLTLEVVFITPFNILMLDPATSVVPPPEEDMVVPTIVMFVPAVKVRWTFGAVKLVKVAFVPDRLDTLILGVVRLVSQFRKAISPSSAVINSVNSAFDSMLSVTRAYIYPLDEFRLDRLTAVFVFTTPFNILIFKPAVSVAEEDMVVPTIVIPVPAVKVGWTLLAVKLVKVAFVPDTLRTFIFRLQLILLQLILVIVPRVALLLVELKLVIVPRAPLILVELKLVIRPVKQIREFVSTSMARTVSMSASSEKMPCEFNPMVSMVSASKVTIKPLTAETLDILRLLDVFITFPTSVRLDPAIKVGWTLDAVIEVADRFVHDRLTILPFSLLTLLMFKSEVVLMTSPIMSILVPATKICCVDMVRSTIAIPGPAIKVSCRLSAVR